MKRNFLFTIACIAALAPRLCGRDAPAPDDSPQSELYRGAAPVFSVLTNFGVHSTDPAYVLNPGVFAQGRDGYLYGTSTAGGTSNNGTVFKINPSTGAMTVIYNFDGPHGSSPYSGLTLGTDGNFYGTCFSGGANNNGTVFKITSAGALTTLFNFANDNNGAAPYAPPIQATDGNFYGTTIFGGADGDGTIYRITSSGSLTTIHAFTGTGGAYAEAPLLQASDGYLYGTTYAGGTLNGGSGIIFKVSTSGAYTVLHNFDGTHGADPYCALIQATDGSLYGTTESGGSLNDGVIFKMTTSGTYTVLYNFGTEANDGLQAYAGVVQGTDGNLYGVTSVGGLYGDGLLFNVTTAGAYSILHNFDGTDGNEPWAALLQHTNGEIYGAAYQGGNGNNSYGTVYGLNGSLPPYIRLLNKQGTVGSTVEILGQGFTTATTVSFGSKAAKVLSVYSTYLTVAVPSGALTPSTVTAKTSTTTLSTYDEPFKVLPVVSSLNPISGAPGTLVTITGSGLTQTSQVTFGGVKATTFTVVSDSEVTATVPSGAKTGDVAITTPGGIASSSEIFTP